MREGVQEMDAAQAWPVKARLSMVARDESTEPPPSRHGAYERAMSMAGR
jgi:hypothetical protein